jgi:hypothetical protein
MEKCYLEHPWEDWKKPGGALDRQTVVTLKIYLRYHKLAVSGNKPELLERIRGHKSGHNI